MTDLVAAVDCGTNTIKLLMARFDDGQLVDVEREMRMVRLGQDVDRTGVLADAALERAFAAIDEYAALIRRHGCDRVRFVATSATRDAANADVFTAGVRERLGIEPEVVPGTEEAALAFEGAVRGLASSPALPIMVVDIGGGSTELIRGSSLSVDAGPDEAFSMDIGSVRLHERHLRSDPPTRDEIAACVADIDEALDVCPVSPVGAATVVGVAGTFTQLAAGVLNLQKYERSAIDQARIRVDHLRAHVDDLLAMTVEARKALPFMHPGRADVIGSGGLIATRVLERSGVDEFVISESDILDGIAWSLV